MDEAAWTAAATRDLKGRPLQKLVWRPEREIALGPLCTQPVASSRGTPRRGWEVLAGVGGDPEALAAGAKEALAGGAEAVRLDLTSVRGVRDLATALRPVALGQVPVEVTADGGPGAAAGLVTLWRKLGVDDATVRVDFGLDPLGELGATGGLTGTPERWLAASAELGRWCAEHAPGCRAFTVDAARWHAAGATTTTALALGIGAAVTAVRTMEDAGVPTAAAFGQVRLRVAVGSRFLLGAASIRAARRIWARIGELAGVDADLAITAVPASRERARVDTPTNALRQTAATFGAIVGGADRIEATALDGDHGPRVARLLQHVLRDEAHLGAVGDPGGGSYALEALTDQLARAVWTAVQRHDGDFVEHVQRGGAAAAVRQEREQLEERVRTRAEPLLGVSRYADPSEPRPRRAFDAEAPTAVPGGLEDVTDFDVLVDLGATAPFAALTHAMVGDGLTRCPPSPPMRLAEPFEEARAARPVEVPVITAGPTAEHGARTAWGVELLAAGGLVGLARDGVDAGTLPGAPVALVSVADSRLGTDAVDLVRALTTAGRRVWVLGRPGEHEDALRSAGAKGFLHAGGDALAVLDTIVAEAVR